MGVKNVDLFEIPRAAVPTQEPQAIEGLTRITQCQTNWCWAACTLMVYRRTPQPLLKQCDIVNKELGSTNCCTNQFGCNKGCDADRIDNVYADHRLTSSQPLRTTDPSSMAAAIRTELDQKRPVEICYSINSTGFHVVLVVGITPKGQAPEQFLVFDPAKTTVAMTIEKLMKLDQEKTIWVLYWTGIN